MLTWLVSLWGRKQKLDSLYLGGDGDEVDLVEDIERVLEVKFEREDLETIETFGDLEGLAKRHGADRQPDLLLKLIAEIARAHTGHQEPISRHTTFFPNSPLTREMRHG